MRKNVIAILTASMIFASFLGIALLTKNSVAADPTNWYMTVSGVLNSDYYTLYPFEKNSLRIGISKFGELIDGNTKVGLEYAGVIDPFAAENVVPEFEWSQGWVINITYAYGGWYRNVWAFALYSDSWGAGSVGGDWKRAPAADSTSVLGGRKYGGWSADGSTIGYVETAPLQVLYNGPRLFVARSSTTIYEDTAKEFPLVRVDLTFVFEKVKKYVIVFKDIKRLDNRKFSSNFQVEFSNRGEWDLGLVSPPRSWAHFFDDQSTCYHEGWHTYYGGAHPAFYDVAQIISHDTPGYVGFAAFWPSLISKYVESTGYISRKTMLTTLETYTAKFSGNGTTKVFQITAPKPIEYPRGSGIWSDEPMVFVNGKLQAPVGTMPQWAVDYPYTWDNNTDTVTFAVAPPKGTDNIWFVYKRLVHQTDMSCEKASTPTPGVPYVIGEWDFELPNEPKTQFRAVTVYGVVNYHDAKDSDRPGDVVDWLDREVKYQLDEVFNPWDLVSAVHKETKRWVEFPPPDGTWSSKLLTNTPVVYRQLGEWYDYCSFAERVLVDGKLLTPTDARIWDGSKWVWWPSFPYTYYIKGNTIYFLKDADGRITTWDDTAWKVEKGKVVKVLYSTLPVTSGFQYPYTYKVIEKWNVTAGEPITVSLADISYYWPDDLGVGHSVYLDVSPVNVTVVQGGNWSIEWGGPLGSEDEYNFKVFMGETYSASVSDIAPATKIDLKNATATFDVGRFTKTVTAPTTETIHVDVLNHWISGRIRIEFTTYPNGSNKTSIYCEVRMGVYWYEHLNGRYEWTIVGRDAATVDSAGAALVTAAFKNKQVEIGLAGADMKETNIANAMPWVMSKFGTGNDKADYKDTLGRAALKDDWCTTWPIASSNMIGVGGPLANILAYYGNDFTPAFYGLPEYASTAWADTIIALSCWSQNTYASNETTGYAVVATYKDLNGTVLFLIWGHWGRDTYYATKWFHEEGIYELQKLPSCATAIILEIDYTVHEPAVSIVESLGTISELSPHPDP